MMINNATVQQNLYYTTANLNVRSGPGTEFTKIGLIPKDELVDVKYTESGFAYIGKGRWVCSRYLAQYTDDLEWKATTTANLNMRKGPSTQYRSIGILRKGTKVDVLREENGWFEVKWNKKTFWLSGMYLK